MFANLARIDLLLSLHVLVAEAATMSKRYTHRREGYRIKDEGTDLEVACSSVAACAALCNQEQYSTMSFHASDERCLLQGPFSPLVNTIIEDLNQIEESGWITMSKVKFPVFMAFSPDMQSMTYDQAVTLCAEHNTVVASPEDALLASSLGARVANCGWVSDETIQQIPNSSPCTGETTMVWCKM